jgi:hypothetical protein
MNYKPAYNVYWPAKHGPVGGKVKKILKDSLDLISSPSPTVKIQIWKQKVCWHHPAMLCLITIPQMNFPANNLNFHWRRWYQNQAIFLNYFLLYYQNPGIFFSLIHISTPMGFVSRILIIWIFLFSGTQHHYHFRSRSFGQWQFKQQQFQWKIYSGICDRPARQWPARWSATADLGPGRRKTAPPDRREWRQQ